MTGFQDDLPKLVDSKRRRRPQSSPPTEETVWYIKTRCPNPACKSDRVPVQHTDAPVSNHRIRHHRCEMCNLSFKSVEVIPDE